jgi:hypothetical protein
VSRPIPNQNKLTYAISFIAHRYLHNCVGILHCDLSINNVLLIRKDSECEATGLLIDYDYSIDTGSEAANHQDPQHSAVTAAHSSGRCTRTVNDSEVPSVDTSEESVAIQVRAEKAQVEIPRTVRRAHLFIVQQS